MSIVNLHLLGWSKLIRLTVSQITAMYEQYFICINGLCRYRDRLNTVTDFSTLWKLNLYNSFNCWKTAVLLLNRYCKMRIVFTRYFVQSEWIDVWGMTECDVAPDFRPNGTSRFEVYSKILKISEYYRDIDHLILTSES